MVVLSTLATGIALRINYSGDPAPGTQTRNRDALWMGHAWVDGRKKDADVKSLAKRLRATGIRVSGRGTRDRWSTTATWPEAAYPKARWLVEAVHRELPGVRVQAWLGDVLATEGEVGMRLERAATRAAVSSAPPGRYPSTPVSRAPTSTWSPCTPTTRTTFPCSLAQLRRVTRAHDAQFSVAAHQIDPLPNLHSVVGAFTAHPSGAASSDRSPAGSTRSP